MLVFLALAESIGVEAILGAFAAGLMLSALAGPIREEVTHKFDLRAPLRDREALLLVPRLLAGTLLTKAVPAILLWIWYPLKETLAGMMLLTTQMSVTIAASSSPSPPMKSPTSRPPVPDGINTRSRMPSSLPNPPNS